MSSKSTSGKITISSMMNIRLTRMTTFDGLTFHRDIIRYVLPEFDPEVNPSIVLLHPVEHSSRCNLMHTYLLTREQRLSKPIDEIFAFFSRPDNLQAITPPWLDFGMVDAPESLTKGSLIRYRLRWHWIPMRWTTEISEWNPPYRFVDRQISGPYSLWHHEHDFLPDNGGTIIRDRVTYALPFGPIGQLAHYVAVEADVRRIFDFRTASLRRLFPA